MVPSRCATSSMLSRMSANGLRVVDGEPSLFEGVDQRGVERGFAQRVEGVDPVVARRRRTDLLRVIELAELAPTKLAQPVVALRHELVPVVHLERDVTGTFSVDEQTADRKRRGVRGWRAELGIAAEDESFSSTKLAQPVVALRHELVPVHLEDVTELLVDEQTADRKRRGVGDGAQKLGIAAEDELLERGLDRQLVHLLLPVDGQRVVHVEAHPRDARHPQVAVAEDPAGPGDAVCVGARARLDLLEGLDG